MTAPTGLIIQTFNTTLPEGWLLCDGSAIAAEHTALIALVGANTPNFVGRTVYPNGTPLSSVDAEWKIDSTINAEINVSVNDTGNNIGRSGITNDNGHTHGWSVDSGEGHFPERVHKHGGNAWGHRPITGDPNPTTASADNVNDGHSHGGYGGADSNDGRNRSGSGGGHGHSGGNSSPSMNHQHSISYNANLTLSGTGSVTKGPTVSVLYLIKT